MGVAMWGAVFPGQGSQAVGMGKIFYENFPLARHLFEEASDTLNQDMKKLCFEGPDSDLALTENTQPALLLVSTVIFKVFKEAADFKPEAGAGHSLGEYSALVAAGVLQFNKALKAVRSRGQFMQSACPVGEGAMSAILGWENQDVEVLCAWVEQTSGITPLRPANYNAPGQVVISGSREAVEWLKTNYTPELSGISKRLKMIPLNVSAPFHCPLMLPAEERMKDILESLEFQAPSFPIVQNTTAQESSNTQILKKEIIRQISSPVKWTQSVERLKSLGVSKLIEFGPGKVLAGLVKKIDSEHFETFNIQSLEDFKEVERRITT